MTQIFDCDICEQFTNFVYEDLLLNNSKFSNFLLIYIFFIISQKIFMLLLINYSL